jgi:hypothetical protein
MGTDVIGGPHDFLPPRPDRSDEFQKLLQINVKFKLQTCSACQDLPTMQF